jgi:hypothetical protein
MNLFILDGSIASQCRSCRYYRWEIKVWHIVSENVIKVRIAFAGISLLLAVIQMPFCLRPTAKLSAEDLNNTF